MARKIIWSATAKNDLAAIYEYLHLSSPRYAKQILLDIRDAGRSLKQFPDRGRALPEYPESGVREIFVDSFRLLYRFVYDTIEVVGVVHMARDITFLA